MKNFEIGQRFWDELNCREITIIDFNGSCYWCGIRYPTMYWFDASELSGFEPRGD